MDFHTHGVVSTILALPHDKDEEQTKKEPPD